MINQKDIYVGLNLPSNNEPLWIKPLTDGNVALYAHVYGEWVAANSHALYYTKQEIDDRFADVLGTDAEGIAAIKALVEDGSALTGLLGEITDKASLSKANTFLKLCTFLGVYSTDTVKIGGMLGHGNQMEIVSSSGRGITFDGDNTLISGKSNTSDWAGISFGTDGLYEWVPGYTLYKRIALKEDLPKVLFYNYPEESHDLPDSPLTINGTWICSLYQWSPSKWATRCLPGSSSKYTLDVIYSNSDLVGLCEVSVKLLVPYTDYISFLKHNNWSTGTYSIKINNTTIFSETNADLKTHGDNQTIDVTIPIIAGGGITIKCNTGLSSIDMSGSAMYPMYIKSINIRRYEILDLKRVAVTASYNDLVDTPTIYLSDWNTTDTNALSYIKHKPTVLSASSGGTTVSLVTTGEKYIWDNKSNFSGSYNDLSNKPTIPSYSSATTSQLGLLKVSNKKGSALTLTETAGTTANRYYGVQMDSNGVAFVNVPWEGTSQTTSYTSGATMSTNTIYLLTGSNGTNTVANNTSFKLPAINNNTGKAIFIIFKPAGNVSFTCETSGRILYNKGNVSSFDSSYIYSASAINDGYRWIVSINKTDSSL